MDNTTDRADVILHNGTREPYAIVFEHLATGELYELREGEYILGRSADSAIPFKDTFIARIHALLLVGPDYCAFRDMQPLNGSFKNGEKISRCGEVQLTLGDTVSLAGREEIRVVNKIADGVER